MAADKWLVYHSFKEYVGDGTIDMDNDDFKLALFLSSSNCTDLTHDEYGDLTNEHANNNGYVTGGVLLAGVSWNRVTDTITFTCSDVNITATGGSIIARYAVIYDTTPSGTPTDPLVCYSLLDNSPGDITINDTNTLTIQMGSSGILTMSGGATL